MKILLIDTSTPTGVIALTEDLHIVGQLPVQKATALVPLLARLFQKNKVSFKEIGLIVTTTGPGLFTGLRIGATVAKTVSFSLGIPLVGISSLKAFVPKEKGFFLTIIDAKKNAVFVLKGEKKEKEIFYHGEEMLMSIADFIQSRDADSLLCTPDLLLPEYIKNGRWQHSSPDVEHLAGLGLERFSAEEFSINGDLPLRYTIDQYQAVR